MTSTTTPMTTLTKLPYDLVIDSIIPKLNFDDISNLIFSKISKDYKSNLYDIVIENDNFLTRYLSKRNMDLVNTIHHSSFTLKGFFQMYDNIKNDVKENNNLPYIFPSPIGYNGRINNYEATSKRCIDATFELFKILMSFVMYCMKFQFRNFITRHMIKYFKNVFEVRHRIKKPFINSIFLNFANHNRDNLSWHTSNINLYYMYENLYLMDYAKRCYSLKKNLETFDDGNIAMTHENHVNTLNMLINLFSHLPTIELKIYGMHSIMKYVKVILLNKTSMDTTKNFKLDKFIAVVKEKNNEFKNDLNYIHRTTIPYHLRKIMIENVKNVEQIIGE